MIGLVALKHLSFDGLQHKGTMSTKHVFEKIAKMQMSYVLLYGHTAFVLLTPTRNVTIIDKITIFCNDINKTCTSVELLARYMSCNVGLETSQRLYLKPSWKNGMEIIQV